MCVFLVFVLFVSLSPSVNRYLNLNLFVKTRTRFSSSLGFEFQGDADLVSASVEALAVNQRRQSQSDSCENCKKTLVKLLKTRSLRSLTVAQLLLIAQTDLALVVNLGADTGILVQVVLGAEAKLGRVRARGPRQLNGGLQTVVASLVDQTTELAAVVAGKRERKHD